MVLKRMTAIFVLVAVAASAATVTAEKTNRKDLNIVVPSAAGNGSGKLVVYGREKRELSLDDLFDGPGPVGSEIPRYGAVVVNIRVHIPEASGQGFRFNVGAHSGVTWAHIPGTWAGRTRPVLTQRKRREDRGRQRAMPAGTVAEWNVTPCAESKKFSDYISTAT